ncbi:MAG: hypothetical protein WAK90_04955 [Pseudolabrys sp.]|jgi:hypothetical protein
MMPRGLALITVATALLLAGCAGHSLDCLTGTSSNNCAPDTLGHQQMVQQQQSDDTVASIDDARCRSYAAPGSKEYLDCRRRASTVRSPPQAR